MEITKELEQKAMTDSTPQRADAPAMKPELAQKILKDGMFRVSGKNIYVFQDEMLSDLPQSKTDEIIGMDIVVFSVKGTIRGTFGESYVTEIGQNAAEATHSWLVNCTSPLGMQLARFKDKGKLPMWAHVTERTSDSGNKYYTFELPSVIARASSAVQDKAGDLEDLPF